MLELNQKNLSAILLFTIAAVMAVSLPVFYFAGLTLGEKEAGEKTTILQAVDFSVMAETAENISAGKDVYMKMCVSCHAIDGSGMTPISAKMDSRPRSFIDPAVQWRRSPESSDMFLSISMGYDKTVMGAFGAVLSEKQIWQLTAFIHSFPQMKGRYIEVTKSNYSGIRRAAGYSQ